MLMRHRLPHLFQYDQCTFNVQAYKAGSARVVFWRDLRQWNSFTLEGSFFGASSGRLKEVCRGFLLAADLMMLVWQVHLNPMHYMEVGKGIGQAVSSARSLASLSDSNAGHGSCCRGSQFGRVRVRASEGVSLCCNTCSHSCFSQATLQPKT